MNERNYLREVGKDLLLKEWCALNTHMFMYIHTGAGGIICQENSYPIKKGVLCFIGARKFHYTMPDKPEEYDRSKVFMSPEKYNGYFGILSDKDFMNRFTEDAFIYAEIPDEDVPTVEDIFEDIKRYEENELYSELSIISGWMRLLRFAHKYSVDGISISSGVVNLAIEYINNNIFTDISIDSICEAIHMSKYYFCRKFKEYTGSTVMQYILNTRIVLAKHMLTKPEISITEVSETCGFSSVSYFSNAFKISTGRSPREYRKNYMLYHIL